MTLFIPLGYAGAVPPEHTSRLCSRCRVGLSQAERGKRWLAMIQILKAADRKRHHLGGVHVCTTLVPSRDGESLSSVLAGITDALLLPGESFEQPTPPPAAHTVLTFVLEGTAEHSAPLRAPSRLPAGSSQIEPLAAEGSGPAGGDRWFNPSPDEVSHLLRFWITRCGSAKEAKRRGNPSLAVQDQSDCTPRLLACPKGSPEHLRGPQGMALWHATMHHGQRWRRALGAGHHAWVNVTSGAVWCCGKLLAAGDTALAHDEPCLRLQARRPAQLFVLEFDV